MNDYIIIGGGVAGLSAALHLAERGVKPVVIEAGNYPAHKICGEFFSPEALPILARWDIHPPVTLRSITFHAQSSEYTFTLPQPAGSMSRYAFDALLASRAQEKGVELITNTSVTGLRATKDNTYIVTLSTGQEREAQAIVIGTGRALQLIEQKNAPTLQKMPAKYAGIKAHIKYHDLHDRVLFFAIPGAYLGLSSVGDGITNIACLATMQLREQFQTPEALMQHLAQQSGNRYFQELLSQGTRLFPEWLTVSAPEFGIKKTPTLPNLYVIGDAAGTIPPASGDGLGIAITSGKLLADYALQKDATGFAQAWRHHYAPIIRTGKILHLLMMQPLFAKLAMGLCKSMPSVGKKLFQQSRSPFNNIYD